MKRLLLLLLCMGLTSCTYLGATEEILISSPYELTISTIETFGSESATTPSDSESDNPVDGSSDAAITTGLTMPEVTQLILSKSTKKIHYYEACSYAANISDKNRAIASADREQELIAEGYTVCSWCKKQKQGDE